MKNPEMALSIMLIGSLVINIVLALIVAFMKPKYYALKRQLSRRD